MQKHTDAGDTGDRGTNERPGWIEDRPETDTENARRQMAAIAEKLGTGVEEWEDDGGSFGSFLRTSPLFYGIPGTARFRLHDERLADTLARAVGAERAEEALRGTLWQLGRADRRLCKAWREVWFLKRWRTEDGAATRSILGTTPRSAFVLVGGGDTAALPAWLRGRAFPLADVARFCEDGALRLSWRAFGQRRPDRNETSPEEEKKIRLGLALDRIRKRLVGIGRKGNWDDLLKATDGVGYRLLSDESGLGIDTIRNLLHRKDADGRVRHPMLVCAWHLCRDPERIQALADRRRTLARTLAIRERAACEEERRTANDAGAVLGEERDKFWNHADREAVRKARIASVG